MTPEQEYEAACHLLGRLESDLENAYISGSNKEWASKCYELASQWYAAALGRLVDSRKPSFETLLGDYTQQFDGEGIVLASILEHQQRTFCTERIPVVSATASASTVATRPATYLCCKPLPCPEHTP